MIQPVIKQSSAPGIDTAGPTRYRSVETSQTVTIPSHPPQRRGVSPLRGHGRFPPGTVGSTWILGKTVPPDRNPYRSAGDAPTLWYPKGRRRRSGASLRTVVARAAGIVTASWGDGG